MSATSRYLLVGLVALAETGHLAWEHFNGGVVSHHLLNNAQMPAVSNGWGLLLLPALTWFVTGRMQRRVAAVATNAAHARALARGMLIGLVGALLWGASLALAFERGAEDVSSLLFFGMLLLALVAPLYRAECLLGFVLGMTFTFGAVLPTLIGSVIVALSAAVHLALLPALAGLWTRIRRR